MANVELQISVGSNTSTFGLFWEVRHSVMEDELNDREVQRQVQRLKFGMFEDRTFQVRPNAIANVGQP